ncbi:hypothetical protein [Streptomyces sp. NPDC048603]|uniref:hypothetical protein n=1 Tax=Streptomyces sp. NPDC048603 TaxID=3365577 RepID=UPI003713A9BC
MTGQQPPQPGPQPQPYGQQPYGQQPYGEQPYGQPPYQNTPYQDTPYGQPPTAGSFGPPPPPPPPPPPLPLPSPAPPTPPPPPRPRNGTGRRTTLVAVCSAAAVLVTAVVTAAVVLTDEAGGGRAAGGSSPAPSAADPSKPSIAGWKTVVNPQHGTAFDVPPDWEVAAPTVFSGYEDRADPKKVIIGHTAPAFHKSKWCSVDSNGDGMISDFTLASAGSKGADGATDTDDVARKTATAWVYGAYAQPDKSAVKWDDPVPYTTKSGVRGSYVKARSEGVRRTHKCAGDGQAVAFGFKNSKGDFVAWDFYGRTGVPGAVTDETIMKILSTVRLAGTPSPHPLLP